MKKLFQTEDNEEEEEEEVEVTQDVTGLAFDEFVKVLEEARETAPRYTESILRVSYTW